MASYGTRVFLDSNVLLSFYEISKDDLVKLEHALILSEHKEFSFGTTEQVRTEFLRRRASVISASIERLREIRLPVVPTMAKVLAENEAYEAARKVAAKAHDHLLKALKERVLEKSLEADKLVDSFFEVATKLSVEGAVREAAKFRLDCGTPPGKKGSLGDALNWEALLTLPSWASLIIVSDDKDFRDELSTDSLSDFLRADWKQKHTGDVLLYRTLSDFIGKEFPSLNIGSFSDIDAKIEGLRQSTSFYSTHVAIAKLSAISEFTTKQVEELISILDINDQVYGIIGDSDVKAFYHSLLKKYEPKIGLGEDVFLSQMLVWEIGPKPELAPF